MKKYTTERGIEIGITPIPLLLDRIRETHKHPDAPTYAEKTASGKERQVGMTPEDMAAARVHNPEWYEEHAAAWADYTLEKEKSDGVLNEKFLNAIALKSVRVEMPKDDTWAEEQAFLGLDVPESPLERRAYYFRTEVIGGTRDYVRIMAMASGVDVSDEVLAAAEDSFQDFLQGNIATGLADQGGAVEGEPEIDTAPGGG